jgi:hypothetical protein
MQSDAKSRLAGLLTEAAEAHHQYETDALKGERDNNWAEWYAEYLLQHGAGDALNPPLAADQLATKLNEYAAAYAAQKPPGSWQDYYAGQLAS